MNDKAAAEDANRKVPQFADYLSQILVCRILGDPRDSIMDSRYFFDTNFHLTDEGREIFTGQLVRDIKAELGDFSKTESIAAIKTGDTDEGSPDAEESGDVDADRSNAQENGDANADGSSSRESGSDIAEDDSSAYVPEDDFYIYEIQDGMAALCGLTEAGEKQTSVSVPSEVDGHPVEIIRASAFAGCSELHSIRIPAGVRMIEDGAFAGCEKLREIVMESDAPETCLVAKQLLFGTNAEILVPADALTAYRLNYNWSVWADRIMPYDRH